MSRFPILVLALGAAISTTVFADIQRLSVDFDYVRSQARELAEKSYRPDDPPRLPRKLRDLSYDQYREIEFRREAALWSGEPPLPFQLQFFHRGGTNLQRVRVFECSPTHVQEIPFEQDFYNYRALGDVGRVRASVGYAGLRVHYPLNRPDVMDELVSFLGASYFRSLAPGQHYGLSARGLALNAALPNQQEEFPNFTTFWVMKPEPGAKELQCFALLDSPSVAGAYSFRIAPGSHTIMTVDVALFWRSAVAHPGWAPLTSMFWYGENTDRPAGAPRPEVHDSDGWWVETAEHGRLWQPLVQADHLRLTEIPTAKLQRFGLLQRDRDFSNYQDLEANYQRRPSAWIEPVGDWGPGRVRLAQLPPEDEYADNVVAYWQPDRAVQPGEETRFAYRLVWGENVPPTDPQLAHVTATRRGRSDDGHTLWWIDFHGAGIEDMQPEAFGAAFETAAGVSVDHHTLKRLPDGRGWRVSANITTDPNATDNAAPWLRCTLKRGPDPISETWSMSWPR